MRKTFKCHMCEEIMTGFPKMRISLIGFNWEPSAKESPGELLDMCEACQHALLKCYIKAKNERMEAIYEKNRTEWITHKIGELEKDKGRLNKSRHAVRDTAAWRHDVVASPSLNYRHEEQKVWRF